VHYDSSHRAFYAKRFRIETSSVGKKFCFIDETKASRLELATTELTPVIELKVGRKKKQAETKVINLAEVVEVRGWKALGNKISDIDVVSVKFVAPSASESKETEETDETSVVGEIEIPVKPIEAAEPKPGIVRPKPIKFVLEKAIEDVSHEKKKKIDHSGGEAAIALEDDAKEENGKGSQLKLF
jgi:topoisomerase-4 subunit A